MNISPVELAQLGDVQRPLVMLSSSGTQLMLVASRAVHGAFIACFRNFGTSAHHLADLAAAGPLSAPAAATSSAKRIRCAVPGSRSFW
jgi:phosphosulfolactate phosphohydrolase-like enzyme